MQLTAQASPPRILVAEDEGITAWDIEQSLLDLGFEIAGIADSADKVVQIAKKSRPDLVLMDVRLRGKGDGIEAAEQIRAEFGVPIVYLTAHGDRDTLERAKRTEPYAYLIKPFKKAELQSVVEVALYRHGVERKLRERERLLATTLRCIGDAVVTTDRQGKVTSLNAEAERLSGWTSEEAFGKPISAVLEILEEWSDEIVPLPVEQIVSERRSRALPAGRLRSRGRELFLVSDSASPVLDGEDVLGAVIVLRDIGEQRKMQEQLEFSDRLASFGTLAAGVAHEINNPLAYVLGNIDYAVERLATPPDDTRRDVVEALQEAAEGGRRIGKIVTDLRTFSRPGPPAGGPVDLRAALRWAIDVTAPAWRHRAQIRREIDPVPLVLAEELRLGQVFINLLINAADAIPEERMGEIRVSTGTSGDCVVVEIQDDGVGLPAAVQSRMFEPFYTTKPPGKGTGLGLSVCRSIIASLGGRIEAFPCPGGGTRMVVVLPALPEGATPAPGERPTQTPVIRERLRLLVIDDDEAVLRVTTRSLGASYEIVGLTSGADALAHIRRGERFDAVICDMMMPGLSGLDVYKALREDYPELADRMILMTGGVLSESQGEPLPRQVLYKPFDSEKLSAVLSAVLSGYLERVTSTP